MGKHLWEWNPKKWRYDKLKILQLHLWIQNAQGTLREPEVLRFNKQHPEGIPSKGKRIVLIPESQSLADIKVQLAKEIAKWRKEINSYYVVVAVERSDGTTGYRTIVPKMILT